MKYLFDSGGRHVANLVNDQLHSPTGENVGHFLEAKKIFVDMSGDYLGEVIFENRLMYNRSSAHCSVNHGKRGNYPNAGNFGKADNCGTIGKVGGYEDIPLERLGQGF